jgi:hypothetical protein
MFLYHAKSQLSYTLKGVGYVRRQGASPQDPELPVPQEDLLPLGLPT